MFHMCKNHRHRDVYMYGGSILVLLLWILTDPDTGIIQHMPIGASTLATLVILLKSVLYITLLHSARKAMFDYLRMDLLFKKASDTAEGSGYALIAISISMLAIALVMYAAVV